MTLVLSILIITVLAAAVWKLTQRTPDHVVAHFADVYDVPLTAASADLLRQTLRRGRRFRLAGGLTAILVGANAFDLAGWSIFGCIAVGYAGGSLADELTRRRHPSTPRAADLERRTTLTYVQRWVIVAIAASALATAAQIVVALRLTPGGGWFMYAPNTQSPSSIAPVPSEQVILMLALAALVVALLGAALLRRLAQSPTPAEAPDLAAVRHAIRTATVVSVSGAVMMVLAVIAIRLGSATTLHDGARSEAFRWVNNVSYFAALLAAFVGANLSLRAFPRTRWFRRLPALPASPSGEPS